MKCRVARERISDYVDGALEGNRMKELRAHLESCRDCRELAHDLVLIARGAKSLTSLEPSDAVWPKIAAEVQTALRHEPGRLQKKRIWPATFWRPSPWAVAAAAILLVIAAALVIRQRPWSVPGEAKDRSLEFTLAKLQEAQYHYEKAIQALSEAVKQEEGRLDPRLAEAFSRNLAAMDETIQACRQIVRQDPDNLTARAYLLTAYREKVNFLEEIMGAGRSAAPSRTETSL